MTANIQKCLTLAEKNNAMFTSPLKTNSWFNLSFT